MRTRLGIEYAQLDEVIAVEATVAREESIGLLEGMRADEKVSDHSLVPAATRKILPDTSAVVCAMGEKLILRVSIALTKVCSSSKASAVSVQTISQAMTEPSERQRRSRFADRAPKVPSAPKMSIRTEESTAVITVWRDGDAP